MSAGVVEVIALVVSSLRVICPLSVVLMFVESSWRPVESEERERWEKMASERH